MSESESGTCANVLHNYTTRVTCTVHCKSRNTEDIPGSGLKKKYYYSDLAEIYVSDSILYWKILCEILMKFRRVETEISVWIPSCISAQIPRSRAGLVAESSGHRVRDRVMNLRVRVRHKRTRVTHHCFQVSNYTCKPGPPTQYYLGYAYACSLPLKAPPYLRTDKISEPPFRGLFAGFSCLGDRPKSKTLLNVPPYILFYNPLFKFLRCPKRERKKNHPLF